MFGTYLEMPSEKRREENRQPGDGAHRWLCVCMCMCVCMRMRALEQQIRWAKEIDTVGNRWNGAKRAAQAINESKKSLSLSAATMITIRRDSIACRSVSANIAPPDSRINIENSLSCDVCICDIDQFSYCNRWHIDWNRRQCNSCELVAIQWMYFIWDLCDAKHDSSAQICFNASNQTESIEISSLLIGTGRNHFCDRLIDAASIPLTLMSHVL